MRTDPPAHQWQQQDSSKLSRNLTNASGQISGKVEALEVIPLREENGREVNGHARLAVDKRHERKAVTNINDAHNTISKRWSSMHGVRNLKQFREFLQILDHSTPPFQRITL